MSMNARKTLAIVFSILILLGSIVAFQEFSQQDKIIRELSERSGKQQKQITYLQNSLSNLSSELNASEKILDIEKEQKEKLIQEIFDLKRTAKRDYAVIGVNSEGKGFVIPLEVTIKSGNGSLFMDVANVLFDETLQSSAQTAVRVAEEVTKIDINKKDILISIHAPAGREKAELGGGSGGAAMTVAIIAALEGRNISRDVLITGTIEEYHTIGKIGAAKEKGIAAKECGARMFIVPIGQNVSVPGLDVREAFLIEDAPKYIAPVN